MTSTGTQVEGLPKGYGRRRGRRERPVAGAAGEVFGPLGANRAGKTTAVENTEAVRRRDGGRIRVRGLDPAEQREPVRHLVIFPAPVL